VIEAGITRVVADALEGVRWKMGERRKRLCGRKTATNAGTKLEESKPEPGLRFATMAMRQSESEAGR
jgi:hypothetical protein